MNDWPALLDAGRRGDAAALGALLAPYRHWLRLLAQSGIGGALLAKFDPSDAVQQTMLQACRDLPEFRGETQAELAAWLRQILAHVLAHEVRRYRGTRRRDVDREVSLEQRLLESSQRLGDLLADSLPSPSQQAQRHERELALADVLARLPADYREVIWLRHIENLPHDEIARRMKRSPGAVRMLWVRALAQMRVEMAASEGH